MNTPSGSLHYIASLRGKKEYVFLWLVSSTLLTRNKYVALLFCDINFILWVYFGYLLVKIFALRYREGKALISVQRACESMSMWINFSFVIIFSRKFFLLYITDICIKRVIAAWFAIFELTTWRFVFQERSKSILKWIGWLSGKKWWSVKITKSLARVTFLQNCIFYRLYVKPAKVLPANNILFTGKIFTNYYLFQVNLFILVSVQTLLMITSLINTSNLMLKRWNVRGPWEDSNNR